jgi:hypothetical protein
MHGVYQQGAVADRLQLLHTHSCHVELLGQSLCIR